MERVSTKGRNQLYLYGERPYCGACEQSPSALIKKKPEAFSKQVGSLGRSSLNKTGIIIKYEEVLTRGLSAGRVSIS